MDQVISATLSHIHYLYEVGMLKVPAIQQKPTAIMCVQYRCAHEFKEKYERI